MNASRDRAAQRSRKYDRSHNCMHDRSRNCKHVMCACKPVWKNPVSIVSSRNKAGNTQATRVPAAIVWVLAGVPACKTFPPYTVLFNTSCKGTCQQMEHSCTTPEQAAPPSGVRANRQEQWRAATSPPVDAQITC
eukprot:748062-Pleurochrysis_carterae.AAC.3